jgi:hypothetical protein
MNVYAKDPNAVLDYLWDWSGWLTAGDSIATAVVTVTSGNVVLDNDTNDTTSVTAWVSGGTAGTTATLTARITTAQLRTDDRTITLHIQER